MTPGEEFRDIYNTHITREGADKLFEWLESTDFFTAPASTKYHLCRECGLVEHSVNVYKRLKALVSTETKFSWSDETVAIVSLLHDICKTNMYVKEKRNRKNDETGRWEKYDVYTVSDWFPYGHGEKSAHIVGAYIKLSREEVMAIRWHMGWSNVDGTTKYEVNKAFEQFPLAVHLFSADSMAACIDEKE